MNYLDPPVITIDPLLCRKDGLCARLCPVGVYSFSSSTVPEIGNLDECVLCGHCLAGCPAGAINHSVFHSSLVRQNDKNEQITSDEAFAFLSQRRSIRNFKPDVPSQELIEKIMEIASYAPGSPHHRIGWEREFIVVLGWEKMQKVLALTADYLQQTLDLLSNVFVRAAAHFDDSARAGMAAKPDLMMRLNEYKAGRDLILYNPPAAIFAIAPTNSDFPATDCSTALYAVLLQAQKCGLGSCWNGCLQTAACGDYLPGFTKLNDYLGIPKGYKCYAAATIGYPAIEFHKIVQRKVEITFR